MQWIILFSLCIATFSANSKAQEHSIEQLLNIEIATYQLSSAFSAYVLFTGIPKYDQGLEKVIATTNPILANAQSNYPGIVDKWQESLGYIERSKELVFSPDDHRLIIGISAYLNPLYQQIELNKQSITQGNKTSAPLPPALEEYLTIRISFERAIAQYTAFSASSAGFVHSDISLEDNVNTFSSQIESIKNKGEEYQRLNMKWNFIKSNMLKNPGETSPFITLHTAIDMRKTLQRIYKNDFVTNIGI